MKRILLIVMAVFTSVVINAQGTWFSAANETTYDAGTELGFGIDNLECMHSDVSGIIEKSDEGAPIVEYNGVTYDNAAFIQGSNNGMYYAFLPSADGTLDLSVKMSSNKSTFVLEMKDVFFQGMGMEVSDIQALTSQIGTADMLIDPNFADYPTVYDTFNEAEKTWNGTENAQETGDSQHMVFSFPVTSGKTYVFGCFGSKIMIRGVNFATGNSAKDIANFNATVVSKEFYSITGQKLVEPQKGLNIIKKIMSDGTVQTSKVIYQK
ncbi:MAG: hypothetical protein PF436_00900 [Prolixibacteraceae bacterium]|jgi:hypothetical protein|nr:hypothetical protein [Prolixibacteraceae bacterium]